MSVQKKRNTKRRKSERILRIGITSRAEMRARTLAVARGEVKPSPSDPKVWFSSLESLAQVLSSKNQALLETIRHERPQSLKELAALSGRAESNLSRTLQTLAQYGFIRLNKAEGRRVIPEVLYDRVALDLPLDKAA